MSTLTVLLDRILGWPIEPASCTEAIAAYNTANAET